MKRTQIIELFSNVKATVVSFFSIMMFVALGVGLFVGIGWTAPALQKAADAVFDEGSFHDIAVQFPYGLTEDDLRALKGVEGVSALEAGRSSFQELVSDDVKYTVKALSITSNINTLVQVEGTLPRSANEVALEAGWARRHGFAVGDSFSFVHDATDASDADGMRYLTQDRFTITALVESPAYLATSSSSYGVSTIGSGSIDALAFFALDAFDAEAYLQGFTDVYLRCDELRGLSTFDEAYRTRAAEIAARVSDLGSDLATKRYRSLHDEAQQRVDSGEAQLQEKGALLADAEAQIAAGEEQLAAGEAQLESGKQQVASGEAQLQQGYQKLISGQQAYDEAKRAYDEAAQLVQNGEAGLAAFDQGVAQARAEVSQAHAFLSDQRAKLESGAITDEQYTAQVDAYCADLLARINEQAAALGQELLPAGSLTSDTIDAALAFAESQLDASESIQITAMGQTVTVGEARAKLADARAHMAEKYPLLASAAAQLESGWAEYYANKQKLDAAKQQIASGQAQLLEKKQQLEDGKQQYEQGKQQYEAGRQQLEDGKRKLESMKEYGWFVTAREYNGGVQSVVAMGNVTDSLRFSMAALFVIVGLLVCYSAVSRIVHEQIVQVGTKKALGLRSREITLSFIAYSALAVVVGAIAGGIVGVTVVEGILSSSLGARFITGAFPPYFSLAQWLLMSGVELALILLATWFACRGVLRRNAIELLAGEKPPSAKPRFFESWALWQRMPLFTQTIVNNCLNDKRRVFGTVIGVAGCTALIVTAVTLNNNVLSSFDRQYERVYSFNAIAYCEPEQDEAGESDSRAGEGASRLRATSAPDAVAQALAAEGSSSTPVFKSLFTMTLADGRQTAATLIVPGNETEFDAFYHVNAVGGGQVDLSDDGVWLSSAFADKMHVQPGDAIELKNSAGEVHRFTVAGFFEYYLTSGQVVMGPRAYAAEFGTAPAENALLVNTHGNDVEALGKRLKGVEGFVSLADDYTANRSNFDMFSQLSRTVVGIYLALSAVMAMVVLLNLNVMFIDEKRRELIVLMINGYSVRQAKRYIYRDTIVLTILGIIAGVALGAAMGTITVMSVEPSSAMFVRDVNLIACASGIVGSAVLAAIMSAIALRRIPRFDLTDINRF